MSGRPRWFAVLTLPNQERRAVRELANQSITTFLPQRQRRIRHARKLTDVVRPLFPRYIFVRLDLSRDRWRCIDGTFGISHIVRFGETPTPLPEGIVEMLIAASDNNGIVRWEDLLEPGQAVRLIAGPFADQLGTLHRMDGAQSVRILLEIMGRCVELRAPRRDILPA